MISVRVALRHRVPYWNLPEDERGRLEASFPDVRFGFSADPGDAGEDLAEAEVFFGWHLSAPAFAAARVLRWIHSPATGVRRLLHPAVVASDVVLTCSRGVHAPFLAEQVMAWLLAWVREHERMRRAQEAGEWVQERLLAEAPPRTLLGTTALLVGYGAAGRELARRLRPFGVGVLAVRRRPERGAEEADAVFGLDHGDPLLARADIVVDLLPGTEATDGFFDRRRLGLMRPGAFFANVGRGRTVDEEALAELLAAGRLAGAGLDVFEHEPLEAASPLWRAPGLQLSPHLAGVGHPQLWPRLGERFAENLRRYRAGMPLLGVVDKTAGY